MGSAIIIVLLGCAESEIVSGVVQAVVIDVIDDQAFGGVGDQAVHEDALSILSGYGMGRG